MERQITLGDVIVPAKVLRCDNDDYPVLSMTMHDGIVLQSNRFKKSLASIDQSNYKVVLRGQLVVGFPIDEGVIYVQNIAEAGIMSPAYGVWNIHSKEIMPEYLELCLHSPQSMDYYKNKLRGTTARRRSITTGDLLALPIILPSLTEQKRRIGLFRQTTLLLNSQKQAMLKFDELVKSRFVELFGALDVNPYNWEISKLNNFCDLQNGYAFKSGDYVESSGVLNCRMSNIRPDGGFDSEYHPKFLPNEFWDQYREYRLNDGDVIIAMTDMASDPKILGVPTIVRTNGKRFLLNQRVGKLTFYNAERINNVYLMFVLSQKNIRQQLVKKAGGSTQINVGKPAILGIEFLVPPIELQEQFAAFVAEVDKSKLAVKQSLEKLETLKKSLMQQYFG